MLRFRSIFWFWNLLTLFILSSCSDETFMIREPELFSLKHIEMGDTVNMLWIGSGPVSGNNLPKMVEDLASDQNIVILNKVFAEEGYTLKDHKENPQLIDELRRGGWDFIVIQEESSEAAGSSGYVMKHFFPYLEFLDNMAHEYSPNVRTVLLMTWGFRNGNSKVTPYPLDKDFESMQERLKNVYIDFAFELNCSCIPAGLAWRKYTHLYPETELYSDDDCNPSLAGSWLVANSIFSTFYKGSYSPKYPEGLGPSEALRLMEIARDTSLLP